MKPLPMEAVLNPEWTGKPDGIEAPCNITENGEITFFKGEYTVWDETYSTSILVTPDESEARDYLAFYCTEMLGGEEYGELL